MLDLTSKLLDNRIIMLTGRIDDMLAESIVSQLLYLEHQNAEKDISLYINSPGGIVSSGFAIYDTMNFIKPEISTVCMGKAASMASFLLLSGSPGKRYTLPNSSIMLHQPSTEAGGQVTDILIQANEVSRLKNKMIKIIAKNCGQSEYNIEKTLERDTFFNSESAYEFGIIDRIIG